MLQSSTSSCGAAASRPECPSDRSGEYSLHLLKKKIQSIKGIYLKNKKNARVWPVEMRAPASESDEGGEQERDGGTKILQAISQYSALRKAETHSCFIYSWFLP